jgi:hypothetical protein
MAPKSKKRALVAVVVRRPQLPSAVLSEALRAARRYVKGARAPSTHQRVLSTLSAVESTMEQPASVPGSSSVTIHAATFTLPSCSRCSMVSPSLTAFSRAAWRRARSSSTLAHRLKLYVGMTSHLYSGRWMARQLGLISFRPGVVPIGSEGLRSLMGSTHTCQGGSAPPGTDGGTS